MTRRCRMPVALMLLLTALSVTCREDDSSPAEPALSPETFRLQVEPAECLGCVVNQTFVRGNGTPLTETITFEGDPGADYIIDIDDLGSQGADGSVTLNGQVLVAPRLEDELGPRHLRVAVTLADRNNLRVRLTGRPGSELQVQLLGGARVIGVDGGTVVAHGAVARVIVPAGALGSPVELQVVATAFPTPQNADIVTPASDLVELFPDGFQFLAPVRVEIAVMAGSNLTSPPQFYQYVREKDWLIWTEDAYYDSERGVGVASIAHFSGYAWELGAPLNPFATYYYNVNNRPSTPRDASYGLPNPTLTRAEVEREVVRAFDAWQGALLPVGVGFVSNPTTQKPEDADFQLIFDREQDYDRTNPDGSKTINAVLGRVGIACAVGNGTGYGCDAQRRLMFINDNIPWYGVADLRDPLLNEDYRGGALLQLVVQHELAHNFSLHHLNETVCHDDTMKNRPAECYQPPVTAAYYHIAAPFALACADLENLRSSDLAVDAANCALALRAASASGELPIVQVIDADDRPVAGVTVMFTTSGAGAVEPTVAVTDVDGRTAVTRWVATPGEVLTATMFVENVADSDENATRSSFRRQVEFESVATPRVFAVAYTDIDPNDGPGFKDGTDVLIARLMDANHDGVVSVGDQVILGRYPTNWNATGFGTFLASELVVTAGQGPHPEQIHLEVVNAENGATGTVEFYRASCDWAGWPNQVQEAFHEPGRVTFFDNLGCYSDWLYAFPGFPWDFPVTQPGELVDLFPSDGSSGNRLQDPPVDDRFINVEIYFP